MDTDVEICDRLAERCSGLFDEIGTRLDTLRCTGGALGIADPGTSWCAASWCLRRSRRKVGIAEFYALSTFARVAESRVLAS